MGPHRYKAPSPCVQIIFNTHARVKLKVLYTNADGLVVNGKKLEFNDWTKDRKLYIEGALQRKLTKEMESNLISPEGKAIAWIERDNKRDEKTYFSHSSASVRESFFSHCKFSSSAIFTSIPLCSVAPLNFT